MEVQGLYLCQIFVFVVTLLFQNCEGFCFRENLMAEMTISRRLRYYCEFKPLHGSGMRLFPGSNLYLVDQCLQCTCNMDGLQCCGFGHAGGAIAFKKDCKMLLDGCQPFIVKKDNHTLDCFTGKPINMTALSEQLPHPDNVYIFETFKLPQETLPDHVTPGMEKSPTPTTTTFAPTKFASSTTLATPTTNVVSTTPSTSAPTTLTNKETSTVASATDIVSTMTTTTAASTRTTGPSQQSSQQNDILTPTFEDYWQYLMFGKNTAPNFSRHSFFSPLFNTGYNMLDASFPPSLNSGNDVPVKSSPQTVPPQQRSNNLWQQDFFLPWFWLM